MHSVSYVAILGFVASASAGYLATTTRYYDGQEGACGCGTSAGNYGWQLGISTGIYTAAASQALFDTDGSSWCGGGCGKCYNLTATGDSACSTCGTGETKGASIIVMVTNLCPYNGNEQWCPNVGQTNEWGYKYHFDIMAESQVFGDNAVVEFEPVACPGQATTDFEQCVCHGQLATDETPAGLGAPAPAASSPEPGAVVATSSTAAPDVAQTSSTSAVETDVASSSVIDVISAGPTTTSSTDAADPTSPSPVIAVPIDTTADAVSSATPTTTLSTVTTTTVPAEKTQDPNPDQPEPVVVVVGCPAVRPSE